MSESLSEELARVLDHSCPPRPNLAHFHLGPDGTIVGCVTLAKWKWYHLFGTPRPYLVFVRNRPGRNQFEFIPYLIGSTLDLREACQMINRHERPANV